MRQGKEADGAKFADYFDYAGDVSKLPSHRILALFRGEKEEVLDLRLEEDKAAVEPTYGSPYEGRVALTFGIADRGRPGDAWLLEVARWASPSCGCRSSSISEAPLGQGPGRARAPVSPAPGG